MYRHLRNKRELYIDLDLDLPVVSKRFLDLATSRMLALAIHVLARREQSGTITGKYFTSRGSTGS